MDGHGPGHGHGHVPGPGPEHGHGQTILLKNIFLKDMLNKKTYFARACRPGISTIF